MNDNFKHFESYRRERTKRRLEEAPRRDLGDNANVLRQLEAAEQHEVREQQLTREVHEFFQAATRQAAGIVSHVTESAEEELALSVGREMGDFLEETIRRAQEFMLHVNDPSRRGISRQILEAHMQNLVGPVLDGFRYAGDVATAEQHMGQDPFCTEIETANADPQAAAREADALAAREADALAANARTERAEPTAEDPTAEDPTAEDPTAEDDAAPPLPMGPRLDDESLTTVIDVDLATTLGANPEPHDPLHSWFARLLEDEEHTKSALKLLVRAALMTKDEARAIWRALHVATAPDSTD